MKVYVVTSLIESQDNAAEINIVGIKKTEIEAKKLLKEILGEIKSMYEEQNIKYLVEEFNDAFLIQTFSCEEYITIQYIESEVE